MFLSLPLASNPGHQDREIGRAIAAPAQPPGAVATLALAFVAAVGTRLEVGCFGCGAYWANQEFPTIRIYLLQGNAKSAHRGNLMHSTAFATDFLLVIVETRSDAITELAQLKWANWAYQRDMLGLPVESQVACFDTLLYQNCYFVTRMFAERQWISLKVRLPKPPA